MVTHTRRGRTASLGVGTPAESSARSTRERNRAQHCGYARRAWPTARNVKVTGRLSDGAAFMDQLSHVSASVVDGELMLFATLVGPALPVDGAGLTAPVQRKFCTLPDGPNEATHGCRRAAERVDHGWTDALAQRLIGGRRGPNDGTAHAAAGARLPT